MWKWSLFVEKNLKKAYHLSFYTLFLYARFLYELLRKNRILLDIKLSEQKKTFPIQHQESPINPINNEKQSYRRKK